MFVLLVFEWDVFCRLEADDSDANVVSSQVRLDMIENENVFSWKTLGQK